MWTDWGGVGSTAAMTPALKLIDKKPGGPNRHNNVYRTFGKLGISIKKVHDAKGAFYVLISEDNLEKILTEENRRECRKEGYELQAPLEYNSMKTVVIKQLDYMVDSYTDEEIMDSITQLNEWAEVEDMYHLPTTSKMIKVRFASQQMVQTALTKGLVILHQSIPYWNVEREIFVRLTPCRNCFGYDHKIKDCPQEKKMRCTYCGGQHKQTECEATVPTCINCGGAHRTLAAACKIRKELIKKRSREIRERSKSHTRQGGDQRYNGTQSYAEAMGAGTFGSGRKQETTNPLTKEETKDMLTIIMSAIVYGHYMEALVPGSFQDNVNEVYRLNGLRTVKFPPPTMAATLEACKEVFRGKSNEEKRDLEEDFSEPNLVMDLDDETIEQEAIEIESVVKRHRESMTPPPREDKRIKQGKETETEKEKTQPLPKRQPNKQTSEQQHGAIAKTREGVKEKSRGTEEHEHREAKIQPRSRASSTSSQQSTQSTQPQQDRSVTKQVGITVYVRKNSRLNINSSDPLERSAIAKAIVKGEAKFTWKNPKAEIASDYGI